MSLHAREMTADEYPVLASCPGPLGLRDHRAFWRGAPVDLTYREFVIVSRLVIQPGIDVTYRQIYDAARGKGFEAGSGQEGVWPAVRSFIKRIRGKFRDMDPAFGAIENYAGYGYRWKVE